MYYIHVSWILYFCVLLYQLGVWLAFSNILNGAGIIGVFYIFCKSVSDLVLLNIANMMALIAHAWYAMPFLTPALLFIGKYITLGYLWNTPGDHLIMMAANDAALNGCQVISNHDALSTMKMCHTNCTTALQLQLIVSSMYLYIITKK